MEIRELEKTLASSRIDAQLKMEEGSSLDAMTALDAPMSSSLGAMGPVLRKLGSLPSPEYRLPKPLKDGIELLKEDLEDISAALVEQSMVDSPNQKSKYWMNEVRDLSYDIEEFIDNMMPSCRRQCQNETSPQLPSFLSTNRSQRVGRVKIARLPKIHKPSKWIFKMAELRNLVQEASERRHRYQLDDDCASSSNHVLTGHGWVPELQGKADANYLVGMDDLRIKLVEWLTNEADQQLKVVPIVGYAGIGKTTLAKQVYHELGGRFECRAFVRASRKPDIRRLLGDILSQVQRCPRPSDSCTVQALTGNLTEHLQDKRYFIVIDDLWETTRWDIVKRAFPEGNNCSRIITTAEIEGVALKCCGHQSDHIFRVKPLDNHDSGKLFFSIAFGCEHGCPDHLKEISNRIIRRCGGLPLATICIAGLLATQPGNFELWYHVQECLGLSTNPNLEETLKQALNLSYNNLPHYLRTCLLYLSMYPEGYTMWKVDLLKQWISECFITSTEEKDSEEVANSYFDELVSMGLIQPVQVNNNDEVLSCTMHHTVLDFIIFKSKEENFITAIDYSRTIAGFSSMVRRLSLHYSSAKYATKLAAVSLSQVRSLVFFGLLRCLPSLVEFKLLRVLVLEFWGDQYGHMSLDLTRICVLFLLRYLKISCDITVELPAQMRGLQYLETLEINARVLSVPLDIIHLPVLLHLSLPIEANLSDGIGRITSLVTLQNFDLGSNSEKNVWSLAELMNLQNLHLTCSTVKSHEYLKRNLAALSSSIGKLVNLKSLTLAPGALDIAIYHDDSSSLSSPTVLLQRLELLSSICIFSRLPEWIRQLRKLCILKVTVGELPTKDIDMLTGLPVLTVLSLHVRRPTAENIIFGKGAFPVLNYFKYRCGVLRLAFQEGAMPNLRWLKLGFNAHRGEQYDGHLLAGVEHLLSLEEIAGITGAAPGAEEPDRRAAESALKDSIRKHPRFSSSYDNNVTRVDWVAEEYEPRIQLEGASNEHHEIVPKQSGSEKEDSSNEQPSITMENKEQCDNSRISHFPTPGSNFSFLDRTKSGAKGSASMTELSVLRGACGNVMSFTFRELVAATRNFREECYIGEGRYGRVYKGRLESAGKVAIKKLNMDGKQGNKEFLEAVGMLSSLHHQNLVNLVGYCVDGDKRLLVYEYMPLGSLEDHLHDLPPKKEPLDWNTRMKIAAGAASGLEYLHDRAELRPVIYKDFKSSKILLDEGFHPKLSKLSLAKLGPVGYMSHFSTRAMAARGYCAPEYATTGKLTVATGVFSFGVVLLELITGRRAIDSTRPHEEQILVTWAWPLLKERRNLPKMADPGLKGRYPMPELYKALEVAAMCIQPEATSRPPIADIVPTLSYLASQTYNPSATHASEKAGGDGRSRRRAVLKNDEAGSSSHKSDRGDSPRLPGKLKRMVAETKKWSANLLEKTRVATSAQGNLDSPAKTG